MSFPYFNPSADQYVIGGSKIFRLHQTLCSAGDIFEVPQGAHAFALGPDSDISMATIAYLDQQARPWYSSQATPSDTNLNTITITPQRTFATFIPALNSETQYQPSAVPGRVLIWPTEVYDATFNPPGFNAVNDRLIREPPVIDIVQFFSPPPTLTAPRADKTYYYDIVPFGSSKICYVLIPYYGRRYAAIAVQNNSTGGVNTMNVFVSGIIFRESEGTTNLYQLGDFSSGSVDGGVGNTRSFVIGAGYNQIVYPTREVSSATPDVPDMNVSYNGGLFDYLLIEVDGDGGGGITAAANLRVIVSDTVGRTGV